MELAVYNIKGEDTGRKVTLNDSVFAIEPNEHVVYLDVKQYLANCRQGTHKAKERSEVSGSTRKLHKQKGGGGARIGDINSPVLVGGGRIFGPKPRDYRFKLNKKVKQLARKSALSAKAQDNQILVVEDFSFEAPKTKDFVNFVKNNKIADKKAVLVLAEQNNNVYLSARNLERVEVVTTSELNTYRILNNKVLVLCESSVAKVNEFLQKGHRKMEISITPIVTEKATALTAKQNRYTFRVSPEANREQIKQLVQKLYGVKVVSVNTMVCRGKDKSKYTKSGLIQGSTSAYKKAIVTLAEGETIDYYSNI